MRLKKSHQIGFLAKRGEEGPDVEEVEATCPVYPSFVGKKIVATARRVDYRKPRWLWKILHGLGLRRWSSLVYRKVDARLVEVCGKMLDASFEEFDYSRLNNSVRIQLVAGETARIRAVLPRNTIANVAVFGSEE